MPKDLGYFTLGPSNPTHEWWSLQSERRPVVLFIAELRMGITITPTFGKHKHLIHGFTQCTTR
jgi:hypothetical protein